MTILNPGLDLTLRPMKYPALYDKYTAALKNNWNVQEVDLSSDINDLRYRMKPAESHMINRLVAFFATGDSIVANNLVISLYKHINSPEARMYLSRQLFEEALHVQFYLTLLDTYISDHSEREKAFAAIDNIPSIRAKADFCERYTSAMSKIDKLDTVEKKRQFLETLIAFSSCVEGLFFFGAFAYVYFLRHRGLCKGLASGTNWVFRDESCHRNFAFDVINIVKKEEPALFDASLRERVVKMIDDAVDCEAQFAEDVLSGGVAGLSAKDMKTYLRYVADQRLAALGYQPVYRVTNPFDFMRAQDVQELANFFERTPSAYQVGVGGSVRFDESF